MVGRHRTPFSIRLQPAAVTTFGANSTKTLGRRPESVHNLDSITGFQVQRRCCEQPNLKAMVRQSGCVHLDDVKLGLVEWCHQEVRPSDAKADLMGERRRQPPEVVFPLDRRNKPVPVRVHRPSLLGRMQLEKSQVHLQINVPAANSYGDRVLDVICENIMGVRADGPK